jgi:hypothetical protein
MLTRKLVGYNLYLDGIDHKYETEYEGGYEKINPKQEIAPW